MILSSFACIKCFLVNIKVSQTYPVLFLSIKLGKKLLKYAHVHISNSITVNKLWKLKRALWNKQENDVKNIIDK